MGPALPGGHSLERQTSTMQYKVISTVIDVITEALYSLAERSRERLAGDGDT